MIGATVGSYRVIHLVGTGGIGRVFEAHLVHDPTQRVALKVLQEQHAGNNKLVARLIREARLALPIDHPAVARILELIQLPDGPVCVVMEYVDGETLLDLLLRTRLPLAAALRICQQAAAGLSAAHEHGVVHRDVKAANIMITHGPGMAERVKVLDFGIARSLDPEVTAIGSGTDDGRAILGTYSYMAPEQFRRPSKVDGKADVYSLGVVLYQCLGGDLPFVASGPERERFLAYLAMHEKMKPPPLPPEIPSTVNALVMAMLAKKRFRRPAMREVADRLCALTLAERTAVIAGPTAQDVTQVESVEVSLTGLGPQKGVLTRLRSLWERR